MSTHTPLPWTLGAHDDGLQLIQHGSYLVCTVLCGEASDLPPEEVAGNISLIQAAPALLEACKRMLRAHDENWRVDRMDFPPIEDIRAALALAEGGAA
jgi:hypothetical protein